MRGAFERADAGAMTGGDGWTTATAVPCTAGAPRDRVSGLAVRSPTAPARSTIASRTDANLTAMARPLLLWLPGARCVPPLLPSTIRSPSMRPDGDPTG